MCAFVFFVFLQFIEASTFPGQLPICSFTWHQFVLVCTICLPAYCLVSPQLWFGLKTRGHDSGWETRHLLARRSRYSPPARWWHKMGMTKMSSSDVRMSVIYDYGNIENIIYIPWSCVYSILVIFYSNFNTSWQIRTSKNDGRGRAKYRDIHCV